MFENPRRGRQARNFTKNVPKILDLRSSSEQIFSKNCRWVPLTKREKKNHLRGTVLDCGFHAMDSGFFVNGTCIPDSNRSWVAESLYCIPDSKAQVFRFHQQKCPGIKNPDSPAWGKRKFAYNNNYSSPISSRTIPVMDSKEITPNGKSVTEL